MYLTGLSSGGSGVWSIAARHLDEFAAIAPMSAGGFDASFAHLFAEAHLPICSFYVAGDDAALVESNKQWRRALLDAGASPLFTAVEGFGHNSWDYAYDQPAFFAWLFEQTRSANAKRQQLFAYAFNRRDLSGWQARGSGTWSVNAAGEVLGQGTADQGGGGRTTGFVLDAVFRSGIRENSKSLPGSNGILTNSATESRQAGYLCSDRLYRDFELHLDFRLVSAAQCSVLFRATFGEGLILGWNVNVVRPELGSGGLSAADGTWLAADDPIAQRALLPDQGNDLRIRVTGNHVVVRINGSKTIDVHDDRLKSVPGSIGLNIPGGIESQILWRDVRIREVE